MIGFVSVNKPSGISSSKVVSILKKVFNIKKIGHMGTLDPLAEGVLPIAIGKATRMFDYFLEKHKVYVAEFTFGKTTDTLDSDGKITETSDRIPSKEEINQLLPCFIGKMSQMPPQFSAKKVNGKCAYNLARNGEYVELRPKEIEIYNIELIRQINNETFEFLIECSGGTYIRSIARDLAEKLNSKAYMSHLVRTKSGKFEIEKSYTIEELKIKKLEDVLISVEDIFDFPHLLLDDKIAKDLIDGKNIKVDENDGEYFVMCDKILIGVGVVKNNILKIKTYLKEDL